MLFDPKWEDETKINQPSLVGLIAWLETQDPATKYAWMDTRDCLMCRYGRAIGLDVRKAGGHYWHLGSDLQYVEWPEGCADASCDEGGGGYTYGAALARARSLAG